ncbi:unnamed protein product [Spirodela intermedia]|uniref:Uncharacterized protein n=1 Tax=Spirodela intermedia TaxID=51605 RepID=A0A7I8J6C4_SPIIN|nr:unnamed protein product [Spirodela intermedia]CAA6665295.1 unnamed protein product [Spirodela intermedia]
MSRAGVIFLVLCLIAAAEAAGKPLLCCKSNPVNLRCRTKADNITCDGQCRPHCSKGGFCKPEGGHHFCHCYC